MNFPRIIVDTTEYDTLNQLYRSAIIFIADVATVRQVRGSERGQYVTEIALRSNNTSVQTYLSVEGIHRLIDIADPANTRTNNEEN